MTTYTKEEWQSIIRSARRVYYNTLDREEKIEFLRHIYGIRNKKDYQSVVWWSSKYPNMFEVE